MRLSISIFNSLLIYRNPLSFHVRVEKDSKTGKFGMSFCLKNDDTVQTICSWSPFADEVAHVILAVEKMLKYVLVEGHKTYFEVGTYLYNFQREDMILSKEDVLTEEKVNIIIFNLNFQSVQFSLGKEPPLFVENEVLVGAIAPQENACTLVV